MKRLATQTTLIAAALAICASAAGALTFEDALIEGWVGAGASRALCVIDFGPASFAFGYRFDGAKTGWDMLSTIAAQTDLDIVDEASSLGHFINAISYQGWSGISDPENWSNSNWWEYWTSPDGEAWTSSWLGCGDRALANGSWDGWTWSPPWPQVGSAPDVPLPQQVPEPGSLAGLCMLLGLAAPRKLLRRK